MGIQLRKMLRSRVVVVFGATSRIGKATIEELTLRQQGASLAVVAAVEDVKDPRARRLKRATNCYLCKCKFSDLASIQRVVRNADSVLLVPALSDSGTRFSKRVIDAVQAEDVARLVIISSVLATHEFWLRDAQSASAPTHSRRAGSSAPQSANADTDLGYEAVEAHARSVLSNCVSLRIPLLMETVLYCREEILFASRFVGCFAPNTLVPCIAVADVAVAAGHVLAQPTRKFNAAYCLAHADAVVSPHEIEQRFSRALGKHVKYRQVSDEQLVALLRENGATLYVAQSMVRLKHYLEPPQAAEDSAIAATAAKHESETPVQSASPTPGQDAAAARRRQLARLGFTNDFEQLVGRKLTTPSAWLERNAKHFGQTPQNQMQLFVIGSGEGFFAEFERFVAAQVTSATAVPAAEVGEAAIPTTAGGASQGKVTFCAIKSIPAPAASSQASQRTSQQSRQLRRGVSEGHFYQLPGGVLSPLNQLLKQLSEFDVIVYIPPLHLDATELAEVTKVVVDAAAKARAWGIVVVSSIFTGLGSSAGLNHLGEMERYIERSGVSYAIVRLPLFMEYFLALSSADHVLAHAEPERSATSTRRVGPAAPAAGERQCEETEVKPRPPTLGTATHERLPGRALSQWNLLDRSLASSRMYLIAMTDAAKALAAIAFTFPLHCGRTRTLYTECLTMQEIEAVLQEHAYKGRAMDFAQVHALHEEPGREFWKVAYWTSALTKELLECSVTLSAQTAPVEMPMTFEEVTDCESISLARWARANAKSYTHALEVLDESKLNDVE